MWFLVLLAVCASFAVGTAIRGLRGEGLTVAGQTISPATVVLAATIILLAFGLTAAMQLGFIGDHYP